MYATHCCDRPLGGTGLFAAPALPLLLDAGPDGFKTSNSAVGMLELISLIIMLSYINFGNRTCPRFALRSLCSSKPDTRIKRQPTEETQDYAHLELQTSVSQSVSSTVELTIRPGRPVRHGSRASQVTLQQVTNIAISDVALPHVLVVLACVVLTLGHAVVSSRRGSRCGVAAI
jgi:hypothetical protein